MGCQCKDSNIDSISVEVLVVPQGACIGSIYYDRMGVKVKALTLNNGVCHRIDRSQVTKKALML